MPAGRWRCGRSSWSAEVMKQIVRSATTNQIGRVTGDPSPRRVVRMPVWASSSTAQASSSLSRMPMRGHSPFVAAPAHRAMPSGPRPLWRLSPPRPSRVRCSPMADTSFSPPAGHRPRGPRGHHRHRPAFRRQGRHPGRVRSGARRRVPPRARRSDARLGLFGVTIPEAYGGLGLDLLTYIGVIEELAYGWMSLSGVVNTHTMAATLIMPTAPRSRSSAGSPTWPPASIAAPCRSRSPTPAATPATSPAGRSSTATTTS